MSEEKQTKEKSPTPIEARLGDSVLPEKNKVGDIVTKLRREVNPREESDLLLKPLWEITGMMIKGRK